MQFALYYHMYALYNDMTNVSPERRKYTYHAIVSPISSYLCSYIAYQWVCLAQERELGLIGFGLMLFFVCSWTAWFDRLCVNRVTGFISNTAKKTGRVLGCLLSNIYIRVTKNMYSINGRLALLFENNLIIIRLLHINVTFTVLKAWFLGIMYDWPSIYTDIGKWFIAWYI